MSALFAGLFPRFETRAYRAAPEAAISQSMLYYRLV